MSAVRPHKKPTYNQKSIAIDLVNYIFLTKSLWLPISGLESCEGDICSMVKSQGSSGCLKLCSPFLTFPSLASHYHRQLQSPPTDSLFSPPDFYFEVLMPPFTGYNLCSLEVSFYVQQTQGMHWASRSRSFYFQIQICSAVSYFLPLVVSKYSHKLILAQIRSLEKCNHEQAMCGYHTAWCCPWFLYPLPTVCVHCQPLG